MTKPTNKRDGRPHLCLTGGWFSSDNIGDHAIMCGLLDTFERLGNPRISVITADPLKVRKRYGCEAFAPKKTPFQLLRNLLDADLLVFTGGTPFYEAKPHMTYYTSLARVAAARGIPVLVFGVSMRSLTSQYCKFMMRQITNVATILGAREHRTLEKFQAMTQATPTAMLVPDAATQMIPSPPEKAATILKNAGVDPHARRVAICMRDFRASRSFQKHHYSRQLDQLALSRYRDGMQKLSEHIVREHDADLLFCPMHTNAPDDDRVVMAELVEAISDPGIRRRCTVLTDQHHPRDMKAILGLSYATVGVRFHSLVLSTSMNVPSLGIAYALKNQAILRQMRQGRYVMELTKFDVQESIDLFDHLVERREEIISTLKQANRDTGWMFDQRVAQLYNLINQDGCDRPCRAAS